MLVELAARAGVALDNAVLFGAERRLALTLQRSLLPTGAAGAAGDRARRALPARAPAGSDVGGDFYLGHPLEDGRLLLVIGDVMGHGPQAAARMGQLRAVLAAYAYDGDPPDRVLAHVSASARPALLDLPMATVLAGDLRPAVAPADVRARRATCRRWSRRSTGRPRSSAPRPGRRWARASTDYERHVVDVPAGRDASSSTRTG